MRLRFIYPRFSRHAEAHPELRDVVPCNEYFGPPSLGIACLAAITPDTWDFDFRDDRIEDVGLDDELDLVAISTFTPSASRAMELADAFRARGTQVVMGGIFPSLMPDVAGRHADAVVVGEGEGVWPQVLADAATRSLKPRYEATEFVDLATLPLPRVDLYLDKENDRYKPDDYPVQTSRGCVLSCVACAIPCYMKKTFRHYPTEHIMGQIEQLGKRGKLASFTEDTSFFPGSGLSRRFGELLDSVAQTGGAAVSYIGIGMPMVLATKDSFYERMRNAGVDMFYLVGGFDPISRGAYTGKDPKARQQAVDAFKRCHDQGIEPYTSFLVGHDEEDEGTFDRILEVANEAGVKKAEFAILTPYPGTPIWDRLNKEDRILHRDWSQYNDANVVFKPAQMSEQRLLDGYLYLWKEFYKSRMDLATMDSRVNTIQF